METDVTTSHPAASSVATSSVGRSQLFVLAAPHDTALRQQAAAFATLLSTRTDAAAAASACAVATRLGALPAGEDVVRLACVGQGALGLAAALRRAADGTHHPDVILGRAELGCRPSLLWLFPGHSTQSATAGCRLFATEAVFRDSFLRCDAIVAERAGWSPAARLHATEIAADTAPVFQAMTFALQVSLARLWMSWGVHPDAVIGHSVGEIAAAHVAGALSLQDALQLLLRRAALLAAAEGRGGMAHLDLPRAEAEALLARHGGAVTIAAQNSHGATVVSGEATAMRRLLADLPARSTWLADIAAHGPLMMEAAQALAAGWAADGLAAAPPVTGFYTTVDARRLDYPTSLDGAYWSRNLCQPVRFLEALRVAVGDGHTRILEISAQPILLPGLEEDCRRDLLPRLDLVASLRRSRDERHSLLQAAGRLFVAGTMLDWAAVLADGHPAPTATP